MHRNQHAHSRKPSLQNAVAWLSRSNSSSNVTHHRLGSKTQISEPLLISEPLSRNKPLGTGAVVVRTPQEALSGAKVLLVGEGKEKEKQQAPTPPQSPDLPPPPLPPKRVSIPISRSSPDLSISSSLTPSPAASPIPSLLTPLPVELVPSPTPTLSPLSDHFVDTAPPVMTPTVPTFKALAVNLPSMEAIDPSKLIVSIETNTGTHRTTFETIISRESHLADFITSLLSNHKDNDSDTASSYSNRSTTFTDNRVWGSEAPKKNVASSMHIFLDRPSAPYTHVLAYLRTSENAPSVLPRAVRVFSSLPNAPQVPDRSRFEALLELRDEAQYLGLNDLHKLCSEEVALVRRGLGLKLNQSHFSKESSADPLFPTPVSTRRGPFHEQTNMSDPPTHRASSGSLGSARPATRPYIPMMAKAQVGQSHGRQAPPGWI